MIYLIHNTTNNTLKIGKSDNPKERLKQLLTSTADNLELLSTIEGDDDFIFKSIYKKYFIIREWYQHSDEIVNTFKKYETFKNSILPIDSIKKDCFLGKPVLKMIALNYSEQYFNLLEILENKGNIESFRIFLNDLYASGKLQLLCGYKSGKEYKCYTIFK